LPGEQLTQPSGSSWTAGLRKQVPNAQPELAEFGVAGGPPRRAGTKYALRSGGLHPLTARQLAIRRDTADTSFQENLAAAHFTEAGTLAAPRHATALDKPVGQWLTTIRRPGGLGKDVLRVIAAPGIEAQQYLDTGGCGECARHSPRQHRADTQLGPVVSGGAGVRGVGQNHTSVGPCIAGAGRMLAGRGRASVAGTEPSGAARPGTQARGGILRRPAAKAARPRSVAVPFAATPAVFARGDGDVPAPEELP
jgi:hypothetical protein